MNLLWRSIGQDDICPTCGLSLEDLQYLFCFPLASEA